MTEIATKQGGHITVEQLHELGLSRRSIQHRLAQSVLIRVHHGVYAVGHLPTSPLDRAHGALLATGPRSALGFQGALAHWRRDRSWPQRLEFLSATDRRPKGLKVHQCTTLLQRDIHVVGNGLRVTSPARTALDMAPRLSESRRTRLVNDLRHDAGLKVAQLRDVVERNPRHAGAPLLRPLIGTAQREPTRSELEDVFLRMLRKHDLPIPEINVHVGGHRADAYFPEHGLVVELDGRVTHGDDWRPAFEADRSQVVDILLATGMPTIRFTWDQMTRVQRETATKLAQILAARAQHHGNAQPNRHERRW